ncbi:MAG: hypothetical protein R6X20_14895 [Phycisphaerae bacterium]
MLAYFPDFGLFFAMTTTPHLWLVDPADRDARHGNQAGEPLTSTLPTLGISLATAATLSLRPASWRTVLSEALIGPLLSCPAFHAANSVWGGYGGRVYSTALATLCLEVYYRFMPLYAQAANRQSSLR